MPHKFKNVTNGIAYRRWLNQSNPELAQFIQDAIGEGFITDPTQLCKLAELRDDAAALEQIAKIKRLKKEQFAKYVLKHNHVEIDPSSIFDVQVKRLHEYKRQLLNGLNILATYQYLKENPNADVTPRTYIFGAKAAPGYFFAKEVIRFLVLMGNVINNDPDVNQKIKLVYLEDYRVTVAEKLMPAADISEQISLAGTEASGTGNMKLMINGAVTLGTLDGANVEIKDAVSQIDGNNILIFGMTTEEVEGLKRSGYCPRNYYENNTVLRNAIDRLRIGFGNVDMRSIADCLINIDHYMVLADYADYAAVRNESGILYRDTRNWSRMSLINTAMAGVFAADRAVNDYARTIWGTPSIK
jgi:starch phosphorylase